MIPPAVVMAAGPAVVMAAVLLDHDGLRVGGLSRRYRKGNAERGKGGQGQDSLTHASFSSGVNIAPSTRGQRKCSNFVWIFKAEGLFM
jgi:hypothetical protein